MNSTPRPAPRQRIALLSRYSLAEQYNLSAEFKGMVHELAARADVMHLSMKGPPAAIEVPDHVAVEELPLRVNRASTADILLKSILLYVLLPVTAGRLRKFRPDIICITDPLPLQGISLKWLTGRKVALGYGDRHLHHRLGGHGWSRPILRLAEAVERFELRQADAAFTRTLAAGDRIASYGVDRQRIRIVPDVPDPSAFNPRDMSDLRRACGFKPEDVVLLYHGVMHPGKGLGLLLDWVAELHREEARLGLILVGTGPDEPSLRAQARASGLGERAYFTGWLPTVREVGDYCNAADICVAMRRGDEANEIVIPGALIHSMACRKVVIAPRMAGMSEVIQDGVNGFLFKPDDGEDFKNLIRRLIARRSEWAAIGQRAYQDTLEKYSVAAAEREYARALEHFAALPPRRV